MLLHSMSSVFMKRGILLISFVHLVGLMAVAVALAAKP